MNATLKIFKLLVPLFFLTFFWGANSFAQVNGSNVKSIETTNGIIFTETTSGTWKEFAANGSTNATYTVLGRDAWSVYLNNVQTSNRVSLDLYQRKVKLNGQPTYNIKSSSVKGYGEDKKGPGQEGFFMSFNSGHYAKVDKFEYTFSRSIGMIGRPTSDVEFTGFKIIKPVDEFTIQLQKAHGNQGSITEVEVLARTQTTMLIEYKMNNPNILSHRFYTSETGNFMEEIFFGTNSITTEQDGETLVFQSRN